jgi:hypothetical protein
MHVTFSVALFTLFSIVSADPGDITEAQLLKIAPLSASCDPAQGATSQCRTAAQAVTFINAAHKTWGITTRGQKAALVGLQVYETGQFKFDRSA